MMNTYVIDGDRFDNIEQFYDEIERVLIPETYWGRNLDAFDDILRGNFGPLDDAPFILIWKNSQRSRSSLGTEDFDTLVEIIRSKEHEHITFVLE